MPKKLPSSSLKRNKRGFAAILSETRGYPARVRVRRLGYNGGKVIRYQLVNRYLSCQATLDLRWMDTVEVGGAFCPLSIVQVYAIEHFLKDKGLLPDHLRVLSALAMVEVINGNRWLYRSELVKLAGLTARRANDILVWLVQTGQILEHDRAVMGQGTNRRNRCFFLTANGQTTLNELHAYILTYCDHIKQRAKTMGIPLNVGKTLQMAEIKPNYPPSDTV